MKLARFWTRGEGQAVSRAGVPIRIVSRGWSDESIEDARRLARERAGRLARRLASDPGARKQYDYDDAPVPEPVIQDFRPLGQAAVITRNSYGALVLNTDELLFADVDQEDDGAQPAAAVGQALSGLFSLFGGKRAAPPAPASPAPDRIRRVAERRGFAARVYKTAAGYRVMITDRPIPAGGGDTMAILEEFGSDPMYQRLCRAQQTFRARLTPKPWRCNFGKPPSKFPFETPREQSAYEQWQSEYHRHISRFATCRFLAAFGTGAVSASFGELVALHDRETRASSDLPLA